MIGGSNSGLFLPQYIPNGSPVGLSDDSPLSHRMHPSCLGANVDADSEKLYAGIRASRPGNIVELHQRSTTPDWASRIYSHHRGLSHNMPQ